jgi:hypothetical protein
MGEYEQAVFVSMKAVEIRVRRLAQHGDDAYGVSLMNRAFGPGGPLVDGTAPPGEQDAVRSLFAGAYVSTPAVRVTRFSAACWLGLIAAGLLKRRYSSRRGVEQERSNGGVPSKHVRWQR